AADDNLFNVTGYDVGPDWENDELPPFPPLTDSEGKKIDAANLRGTRLFGYKGCGKAEKKIIDDTYVDFSYLAALPTLKDGIAWNDQA
ncbi:hypothetical protein V2W45_1188632, partial [Cenococcum geophilum]